MFLVQGHIQGGQDAEINRGGLRERESAHRPTGKSASALFLPQWGPGQSPGEFFWHFQLDRTPLMTLILVLFDAIIHRLRALKDC